MSSQTLPFLLFNAYHPRFGHMGDGNLHLNIVGKEYKEEVKQVIEPFVYEIVGKSKDPPAFRHLSSSPTLHRSLPSR